MLQLVARYADAWNTAWHIDPAVVKQRYEEFQQACAAVGRDPATIELTVGTEVRLKPGIDSSSEKAISGSAEEIARRLQDFAGVGAHHLIVALDPVTPASIEQFGHIVELAHRQ
jgi:alkanesulfonate monooxygenase SsuD/methylene tetrahydromethanopterin reductase-like flavin-dependent oxidoreductase (luciferase family)